MLLTSLLLNHPIPRESVELGRLVLDPKYPDLDFCQPSFQADPGDAPSDATNPTIPSFIPDVATQRLENFHEVLQRTRGIRLELSLLNLLLVAPSVPARSSSASVTATRCVTHQLRNASAYFSAVCQQTKVRAWLEKESQGPFSTIYLICGFKTLADARVELARNGSADLNVIASVPAAVVASAAGVLAPIPLDSGLDVGGSLSLMSESREIVGYTAVGEQVFAV